MADTQPQTFSNGGINGDSNPELHKPENNSIPKSDDLNNTIESLKTQNLKNESRIAELESEIETHKKAAEAIAKRAFELEGHTVRLEHDLTSAMNEADEANRENRELKEMVKERESLIVELRREKVEVEDKVKKMEDKMEELLEKSKESDKLIGGLMEKISERDLVIEGENEKKLGCNYYGFDELLKNKKVPLMAAVSVGVVVTIGACYFRHTKK